MNTVVTSREAILAECRRLVVSEGLSSINMRTVAKACGVAVGSIYNYFPSKADLISAAVEDVWKDIFHMSGDNFISDCFTDCLAWLFESIKRGCIRYPGFFSLHSMSFAANEKETGRRMMEQYFTHMKENLLKVLTHDPKVRPDAFSDVLTAEDFVDVIFTTITAMLLQNREDCGPLLEMAGRCVY